MNEWMWVQAKWKTLPDKLAELEIEGWEIFTITQNYQYDDCKIVAKRKKR